MYSSEGKPVIIFILFFSVFLSSILPSRFSLFEVSEIKNITCLLCMCLVFFIPEILYLRSVGFLNLLFDVFHYFWKIWAINFLFLKFCSALLSFFCPSGVPSKRVFKSYRTYYSIFSLPFTLCVSIHYLNLINSLAVFIWLSLQDSISLLKFSVCLCICLLFSLDIFKTEIIISLKFKTDSSNIWIIYFSGSVDIFVLSQSWILFILIYLFITSYWFFSHWV